MPGTLETGRGIEALARRFLEQRGLELVESNYACRAGELDLVMLDGDTLVVAEVRYRARSDYGRAEETVDARKQARLVHATEHFLLTHERFCELPVRFDVLAVAGDGGRTVTWIRDAFQA
ncbi:MAG TPA: YraN family protein [Gammaproteobacteria bacterium]|nr:YraN family protein [Gammaproteobacteria bacterium]